MNFGGNMGAGLDQMANMSDEELKAMMQQAKAFNPAMANMDPAMMRQAMNMMKGMSPE
jgi:hypothetical protein